MLSRLLLKGLLQVHRLSSLASKRTFRYAAVQLLLLCPPEQCGWSSRRQHLHHRKAVLGPCSACKPCWKLHTRHVTCEPRHAFAYCATASHAHRSQGGFYADEVVNCCAEQLTMTCIESGFGMLANTCSMHPSS